MSTIHIVSTSEFKLNQKKFFDLAETERVVIKRGKKLFELIARPIIEEGVSQAGDAWFDNPANMDALQQRIEAHRAGKSQTAATLTTAEDVKRYMRD